MTDVIETHFFAKADDLRNDVDLARVLGTGALVSAKHMHGNHAVRVAEPSSRVIAADALATDVPGLVLTTRFADCQGFVVFDPVRRVVAVIHAGWRGLCARVITSTFDLLTTEWGTNPADALVEGGPSLCRRCAEFTDPLREAPELSSFVHGRTIDLVAASTHELLSLGVRPEHLTRSPDCTRCHPELYWTYRGGDRSAVSQGATNVLAICLSA